MQNKFKELSFHRTTGKNPYIEYDLLWVNYSMFKLTHGFANQRLTITLRSTSLLQVNKCDFPSYPHA